MNDTLTISALMVLFIRLCILLVVLGIATGIVAYLYRQFVDRYTIHPGGKR